MKISNVRLVPVGQTHLALLYRWAQSEVAFGDYDEPTYDSADTIERKWQAGHYATTWIVENRGLAVGFCSYFRHPWNDWIVIVAVIITEPNARGKGIGTEIHQQLAKMIFETSGVTEKIEAYTDYDNFAEQRVLEKTGFVQEGRTRLGGSVRGELRDMYLYGLLRTDHSAR